MDDSREPLARRAELAAALLGLDQVDAGMRQALAAPTSSVQLTAPLSATQGRHALDLIAIERRHLPSVLTDACAQVSNEPLDSALSAHLLHLVLLFAAAELVFQDRAMARIWMIRAHLLLDGATPVSLVSTPEGTSRAETVLFQLYLGVAP